MNVLFEQAVIVGVVNAELVVLGGQREKGQASVWASRGGGGSLAIADPHRDGGQSLSAPLVADLDGQGGLGREAEKLDGAGGSIRHDGSRRTDPDPLVERGGAHGQVVIDRVDRVGEACQAVIAPPEEVVV